MEGSGLFDTFFLVYGGTSLKYQLLLLTHLLFHLHIAQWLERLYWSCTYRTLVSQWVPKCWGHHSGSLQVSKLMAVKYAAT